MLDRVKEIVLSGSVVVLFGLYALQRQTQSSDLAPSLAQSASVANPTATQVPTGQKPFATSTAQPAVATETPASAQFGQANADGLGRATRTPASANPTATEQPTETPTTELASGGAYRDGTYTGDSADARWGDVVVQAVVTNGQLSDVQFEEFPNHRSRSQSINQHAMPILIQEAIQSQSAEVDLVSGATDTSEAFIESLGSALSQAAK